VAGFRVGHELELLAGFLQLVVEREQLVLSRSLAIDKQSCGEKEEESWAGA
jgi:hypothetical protein